MKKIFHKSVIYALLFVIIFSANLFVLPIELLAQSAGADTLRQTKQETANQLEKSGATAAEAKAAADATGIKGAVATGLVEKSDAGECNALFPSTWMACFLAAIAKMVLQIAALITGLAGVILNFVVYYTVVQMKYHYDKISAINVAWTVIRDIANMSFIFILLYTSIMTILGKGDYKRTIINMVIAGLLVNFSLFFTKVAIDASNLLALTFYKAIAPASALGLGGFSTGISDAMMQPLGLQSIFELAADGKINSGSIVIVGVMGTIVSLIAAFIFVAISLMFVIRYVILIFVLIFSPIVFVSSVIPGLQGYRPQWISALTGQAMFAPVYFLLTWITISIMQGTFAVTGLSSALQGVNVVKNGANGMAETLFNFVVIIAFLIGSLIISKTVSDKSGMGVNKFTSKALGFAGAATFGIQGRLGRATIGRYSQSVANDKDLQTKALSGDMGARLKLATAQKMGKSSFDGRATGLGTQLGAGKGQIGGFAKDQKNREDALKAKIKNLGTSDREKDENKEVLKNAAANLESAKTNRNAVKKQAEKDADTEVPKSLDLRAAENAEAEAQQKFARGEINEASKQAAKDEADRLRQEHTAKRQVFIETKTAATEETHKTAEKAATAAKNRNQGEERILAAAEVRQERIDTLKARRGLMRWMPHKKRVLMLGKIKVEEEDAPMIIRNSAKGQTDEEKLAELAAKVAQQKKDKENEGKPADEGTDKKKESSDGETSPKTS